MLIRSVLLVLLVCLSGTIAAEQAVEPESTFSRHNIGAAAGFVTGYGLSYRHWFPSGRGVQVTMAPVLLNSETEKRQQLSMGVTGLKLFRYGSVANLYGYTGVHGHYFYREYEEEEGTGKEYERSIMGFIGVGPGIDIHVKRLSFNFMCGLAARFSDEGEFGIQMSGEVGIYYSF